MLHSLQSRAQGSTNEDEQAEDYVHPEDIAIGRVLKSVCDMQPESRCETNDQNDRRGKSSPTENGVPEITLQQAGTSLVVGAGRLSWQDVVETQDPDIGYSNDVLGSSKRTRR